MKAVIDGAAKHRIWTGVCGEMAGDLLYLPLLVGLGVDELSVGAPLVPFVKEAVRSLNHADCTTLANKALEMHKGSKSDKAKIYFVKGEALMYSGDTDGACATDQAPRRSKKASASIWYLE